MHLLTSVQWWNQLREGEEPIAIYICRRHEKCVPRCLISKTPPHLDRYVMCNVVNEMKWIKEKEREKKQRRKQTARTNSSSTGTLWVGA